MLKDTEPQQQSTKVSEANKGKKSTYSNKKGSLNRIELSTDDLNEQSLKV